MRTFGYDQIGKPITLEERLCLEEDLEIAMGKLDNLEPSTAYMVSLCGYWTEELERVCVEHDIRMIQETLRTGIWTDLRG